MILRTVLTIILVCAGNYSFDIDSHAFISKCTNKPHHPGGLISERSDAAQDTSSSYRLAFVTNYRGTKLTVGEEQADRIRLERMKSFTSEINNLGKQGYRFVSAVRGMPVAILRLEEGRYEYDWFETQSSVPFSKGDLGAKLLQTLERNFRVVDHLVVGKSCEFIDGKNPDYGENCTYKDLFLVETGIRPRHQVEQLLISASPGWGSRPSVEMTSEIDEKLAEGFYPVRAISKFEILLERVQNIDDVIDGKPDVKVIRSGWGDRGLEKQVNILAMQGYRLAMTNYAIAVMYRNNETRNTPVSYSWIRADKKSFEKELAKLQKNGNRYRTTYPNEKGDRNTLIFEHRIDGKGERWEYRTLNLEFDYVENVAEGKVNIDLIPSSKDAVDKLNVWAKEGFIVRDLFNSKTASVLLERAR